MASSQNHIAGHVEEHPAIAEPPAEIEEEAEEFNDGDGDIGPLNLRVRL